MTDIIIQGIGGRMGHVLCEMIAQREDCRVVAGIDMKDGEMNGIPVYDSLDKLDGTPSEPKPGHAARQGKRVLLSPRGREGSALL